MLGLLITIIVQKLGLTTNLAQVEQETFYQEKVMQ
jgi:hypothetical protein